MDRWLTSTQAEITDNSLRSARYGDVYHSKDGAIGEAMHVFIEQSDLANRFSSSQGTFVVAELGFGAGLNFLLAWDCWRKNASDGLRLHYQAWEAHPLDARELEIAHALFPELKTLALSLASKLPHRWPGWHAVEMEDRVTLGLSYEHAANVTDAGLEVDAWFLDGFSPSKNPAMWTAEVLGAVGRMTAPGGTVATFSSASAVRNMLKDTGLEVEAKKGYGRKRSMTIARKKGVRKARTRDPGKVAVIGAGIAGASVAYELRQRGVAAQVIDPDGTSMSKGASSNPSAMLSARVGGADSTLSSLAVQSFSHALRLAMKLGVGKRCGLLSLWRPGREEKRQLALREDPPPEDLVRFLDNKEAEAVSQVPLGTCGLHVPLATVADGRKMTGRLLEGCKVIKDKTSKITRSKEAGFHLDFEKRGKESFDTVVLTASHECAKFHSKLMRLGRKDGQMHLVKAGNVSKKLDACLQFGGMLFPAQSNGSHFITDIDVLPDHFAMWMEIETARRAWQASRCITPDHHPLAGAILRGHYILCGLGYRGFTFGPLLAADLVADMLGEPPVMPRRLKMAVSPERSLRTGHRRQKCNKP